MKRTLARWFKWQRGQALAEYWPTLPAGVAILLAASALTGFMTETFLTTHEALDRGGLECEGPSDEEEEGPEEAHLGCHSIKVVGRSYDADTDRTTVAYQVTSGCDPSISHWVLGIPPGLQSKLLSSSEGSLDWGTDPSGTNVTGLKFDEGYESGGGSGGGTDKDKDNPGGGKGKDKDKKARVFRGLPQYAFSTSTTETRNALLTFGGYFEWEIVDVGIKAGTEIYTSTIIAPVTETTPPDEEEDECNF